MNVLMRTGAVAAGLVMVATAQIAAATAWALPVGAVALALALLGVRWPRVAVGAVLAAVAMLALGTGTGEPRDVAFAVAAGLAATAYLVGVHADPPVVQPFTPVTLAVSAGFAAVAAVAALLPTGIAWVPLAAPVLIVLIFAVAVVQVGRATRGSG